LIFVVESKFKDIFLKRKKFPFKRNIESNKKKTYDARYVLANIKLLVDLLSKATIPCLICQEESHLKGFNVIGSVISVTFICVNEHEFSWDSSEKVHHFY
jgi:hypothetical protein